MISPAPLPDSITEDDIALVLEDPMSWSEIEDRLSSADRAAVTAVYAYNHHLEQQVVELAAEVERLRGRPA